MAVRKREGRKSPFEVYWINPYTKRRESASFATEEEAKKEDSLVKHRLRFERESFRPEKECQEKESVITLEMAYILYLREKQYSSKELKNQMEGMRYVLTGYGQAPANSAGKEMVEKTLAFFQQKWGNATVRRRMTVLKAFLNWCAEKGFCEPVPVVKMPRVVYKKFVPPTLDEIKAMLAVAPPHIFRVLVIGSQCGVRVGSSELYKLTWNDVDWSQKLLRVPGAKKNMNAPWREIPLRDSLIGLFSQWHEEDAQIGAVHIVNHKGHPVATIKAAWHKTLKDAGITRRIRPYDLRHAFATQLIAAGADVGTVAKLMGHSNPTMLLTHYQYVMDKQKRQAIECLPEIGNVAKPMWPKENIELEFQIRD